VGRRLAWGIGIALAAGAAAPAGAAADTYTVTNSSDGAGSLRDQIAAASAHPGPDTVDFAPSVSFVVVQDSPIPVTGEVTVTGPGQDKLRILGFQTSAFTVASTADASFEKLSVTNSRNVGGAGGAFANDGKLTLTKVTLESNGSRAVGGAGGKGGGVYNTGTLAVADSTFTSNGAGAEAGPDGGQGGAIYNSGTATIDRSTLTSSVVNGGPSFTGHGGTAEGGAIYNTGTLALTDSTIAKSQANGGSDPNFPSGFAIGAGISNQGGGKLTIRNSTLNGNDATGYGSPTTGAAFGGAIENGGAASLDIRNSTIANNTASSYNGPGARSGGGGIDNTSTAESTITGTTFSGNAAGRGATIASERATLTLRSSILADARDLDGNPAANCADPTLQSAGYNIESTDSCRLRGTGDQVNTDPGLRKLTDNGGPTQTMAFGLGSPAVDQGVAAGVDSDQRGAKRPVVFPDVKQPTGGDGTDVGAYELQTQPGDTGRKIDGRARKRTVTAGRETCITFKARRKVHGEVRGPLRNVTLTFAGESRVTGRKGKVRICRAFQKPGVLTATFTKNTFKPDTARVRVVAP
jgi:hypothetical protein